MATVLTSYQEAAAFRADQFMPVPIAGNERGRVVLICFEPGQFIPVHHPEVDMTLVILEGEGGLVAGDQEQPFRAGTIAFIPAGENRGVKAESRVVAVHVVSPPPTSDDHAQVVAGLHAGVWR